MSLSALHQMVQPVIIHPGKSRDPDLNASRMVHESKENPQYP
jgi:hypothetical protein